MSVDFSFEVESRVYADLDAKFAEGDWTFDQADARTYGEITGRAAGAAACSAMGLPAVAPLCAQIGGAVAGWLVGIVWGVFGDLFGDNAAERHAQWQVWKAWYDAQIAGIRQAHDASEAATRAVVAKLAELSKATIGSAMKEGDWISLLASEGAQLIPCDQELVEVVPACNAPDATPVEVTMCSFWRPETGKVKPVRFRSMPDQWPCSVSRYSLPVQGAAWWLALLKRDPPGSYDRAWIEPAFAAQRAYLDSLRVAAMKSAARLIAIGAAAEAEAQAKILAGEGQIKRAFFEARPDYDAPAPGWGAIGLISAGTLGLVLLANR